MSAGIPSRILCEVNHDIGSSRPIMLMLEDHRSDAGVGKLSCRAGLTNGERERGGMAMLAGHAGTATGDISTSGLEAANSLARRKQRGRHQGRFASRQEVDCDA